MERGQILFWLFGELSDSNQSIKSSISMDDIMDIINESSDDLIPKSPTGEGDGLGGGGSNETPVNSFQRRFGRRLQRAVRAAA